MEKAKKLIFISCVITLIISTINVLDTELLTSTIDFIITITVFLTAILKQINLLKYNKLNKSICQIMKKSLIYGVSTAIIFYITTVYILEPFGMFITYGGDSYTLSYHMFSYMGLVLLSGIIVFCTSIIIQEINYLIEKLDNKN